MMFRILATVFCASAYCYSFAQSNSNTAFAITSKTNGTHEWTEIRQINLLNGEVVRNVFENSNTYELFDGRSSRRLSLPSKQDSAKENILHPFAGLSAACAYDAKSNRLYYTPMFINQLRYIDLNAAVPAIYIFANETLCNVKDPAEEANQFTRMVIAADGHGYALNNDGNHLVRFTTKGKPVITDLGALRDDVQNGEMSVHDANTSWGGDMLADASGNLYVISAHNHVFRIDVNTLAATYVGEIKGLPTGFTTNGAVVADDGKIVVSSANFLTCYFTVDPESWQATTVEGREQVYNTSDLANEKLLFRTNFNELKKSLVPEKISVFPNPVKSKTFRVNFVNKDSGKYHIQLVDMAGRMVTEKVVSVYNSTQLSEVRVAPSLTPGVYLVKVLNHPNTEVFTKKIVIE